MKAFVTGGTGFIGRRVVQKLVGRGDEVYALVRSDRGSAELEALGAHPIRGDITDRESMREAMRGSDVVFHIAGWYKLGSRDWKEAEAINIEGTRNVLELAHEQGVPKIVYTSTVAVFGDTHGQIVDENSPRPTEPFLTEYDRTKSLAHFDVALPLIEQGAPIIIVLPGAVYGPGDPSLVGDMMRAYRAGLFPLFPAPDLELTFAHVDDIAEGHLLAADKGRPGESYILAGPALKMSEMAKIWAEILGRRPPAASIPAPYLQVFLPLLDALSSVVSLPGLLSRDAVAILDATYTARPDKARTELGWQARPVEEGMRETLQAMDQEKVPAWPMPSPQRQLAGLAIGAAIGLTLAWLVGRRRKKA
jgi:nucleoside-diphosphate-sugar epimerase